MGKKNNLINVLLLLTFSFWKNEGIFSPFPCKCFPVVYQNICKKEEIFRSKEKVFEVKVWFGVIVF